MRLCILVAIAIAIAAVKIGTTNDAFRLAPSPPVLADLTQLDKDACRDAEVALRKQSCCHLTTVHSSCVPIPSVHRIAAPILADKSIPCRLLSQAHYHFEDVQTPVQNDLVCRLVCLLEQSRARTFDLSFTRGRWVCGPS